jgi:hypothetical protein
MPLFVQIPLLYHSYFTAQKIRHYVFSICYIRTTYKIMVCCIFCIQDLWSKTNNFFFCTHFMHPHHRHMKRYWEEKKNIIFFIYYHSWWYKRYIIYTYLVLIVVECCSRVWCVSQCKIDTLKFEEYIRFDMHSSKRYGKFTGLNVICNNNRIHSKLIHVSSWVTQYNQSRQIDLMYRLASMAWISFFK